MMLRLCAIGVLLCFFHVAHANTTRCDADEVACNDTEVWVRSKIIQKLEADIFEFCPVLKPVCDPIRPRFLRALIVKMLGSDSSPVATVRLRNAFICEGKTPENHCTQSEFLTYLASFGPEVTEDRNGFRVLDLRDLLIAGSLDLRGSTVRGDIWLGGARFEQVLNLDESTILGDLDAHRLYLKAGLTMVRAQLAGNFEADNLRSDGTINLFESWIAGRLHMRSARITDDLDLGGLKLIAPFSYARYELDHEPRNSVGTPRSWLDLSNAMIGRQLLMTGSWVPTENADLSGISVGGSIWIEADSVFSGTLRLERSHIGDSLMLGQGTFGQIDLTAARVDHELRLESGGKPATWDAGPDTAAWLTLRNARIGEIRDTALSWPECITLTGFVYDRPPRNYANEQPLDPGASPYRLCRFTSEDGRLVDRSNGAGMMIPAWPRSSRHCEYDWLSTWDACWQRHAGAPTEPRSATWWLNWIERDPKRTEQTYVQLASALRNAGDEDTADAIQFARRIWERGETGPLWPSAWLSTLEQVLVGFGIGSYALIALFWTLLAAGAAACGLRGRLRFLENDKCEIGDRGRAWCAAASLLTVLPLIPVPKSMDEFLHSPIDPGRPTTQPLRGGLLLVFSGLTLLGFILGGFLLHGFLRFAGL